MLFEYLERNNITISQVAKGANIPYATVHDLATGKTNWKKMNVGHFIAMADYLHLTLQEFKDVLSTTPFKNPGCSAELDFFRSAIGHELKRIGTKAFIRSCADGSRIENHLSKGEDAQGVYLVAMVYYLCRIHRLQIPEKVRPYGNLALSIPLYPESVVYEYLAKQKDEPVLLVSYLESPPEFRKRNILEGEIDG